MIKVGDWGYHDFQLGQVKEVTYGGSVDEFTTGIITGGGRGMNFYPLTMRNKLISENFETCYEELRHEAGTINLNWPDIHRYYVSLWRQCMNLPDNDEGNKDLHDYYNRLYKFNNDIRDKILDMKFVEIDGVNVLVRR